MGCGYDLALTPEFSNTTLYKTMNIQSIILLLLIAAAAVWAWWFHHSQGGGDSCHGCHGNCHQCPGHSE